MARDTKAALLDAAEHVARRRGFDGFSYADLAGQVGIRKASIHYHFPSKADLSAALMARYCESMAAFCESVRESSGDGAEQLARMVARYRAALAGGDCVCLCVALIASRDSLAPGVIDEIARYRTMMADWLAEAFRTAAEDSSIGQAGDPAAEAAAALALLEGAQLGARAAEDPRVFDRAVALLMGRLGRA